MNSKLKKVGYVAMLLCPNNVVAFFSMCQYSPLSGYHNVAPVASCVHAVVHFHPWFTFYFPLFQRKCVGAAKKPPNLESHLNANG